MTASGKLAAAICVFLGVWVTALVLPFIAWCWLGIAAASVVGFLVPIIWVMTMPCTCMDGGGLGGSLLAMVQVLSGATWAVVGIVVSARAVL
jgi:hypothetical protein